MSIEDRIRLAARDKIRVNITGRKRCASGFIITASDGTNAKLPTRQIALQFLLATVRCTPARVFSVKPAKSK